jgi:hypothetical protein
VYEEGFIYLRRCKRSPALQKKPGVEQAPAGTKLKLSK